MVILGRIWKLFFIYSILLIVLMTLIGFLSQWELEDRLQDHLKDDALVFARLTAKALPPTQTPDSLEAFCREYEGVAGYRITIIDRDGTVIGESDQTFAKTGSRLDRPEIQDALRDGVGASMRYSETLGAEMLYTAVLMKEEGLIVRVGIPMTEVMAFQNQVMIFFVLALYLSPIMAILAGFLCTRHSLHGRGY